MSNSSRYLKADFYDKDFIIGIIVCRETQNMFCKESKEYLSPATFFPFISSQNIIFSSVNRKDRVKFHKTIFSEFCLQILLTTISWVICVICKSYNKGVASSSKAFLEMWLPGTFASTGFFVFVLFFVFRIVL